MNQIIPLALAVLLGNLLTVMLVYGLARGFKIYRDDQLDAGTFWAMFVPIAFMAVGFFLYL
jgi:competence protein ComGF